MDSPFYNKGAKYVKWNKEKNFNECWESWISICKRMKLVLQRMPTYKSELKVD